MAYINGKMEEGMSEGTRMIKNQAMANIIGMMEECSKECGKMEKDMVKVEYYYQMGVSKMEYGRTTKESMLMIEMKQRILLTIEIQKFRRNKNLWTQK